jgi:PAS domain S-box-containing protein
LQGEDVVDYEIMVVPRKSKPHVLSCNGQQLIDNTGNKVGAVIAMHDITERKRAEEELQESEEKYKTLFNYSPVNITIHDKDTGEVVDANEVAYRSYGYTSLAEFKKNEFWMEPPYSFREALEWIHKAYNEGIQSFEWKNRNLTGDIFWEYVTLRPVTINGRERVFATAIDITKRKNLESQLLENEERYRTIFNNSEVSLWEENFTVAREEINKLKKKGIRDFDEYFDSHPDAVWDIANGIKVIDINEATLRMYGASTKEEMLGSLDRTLYLTDDTYSILKKEFTAIAEGRTIVQGEMKTKTLDGTILNIMMNVYISNEKDIMIVAISDVTTYKKALSEKDFLMKELNHRVKNNLALVASLIYLKDTETEDDLSDLKHRIEIIKLVHEKLYHQNNVEQIEMREYFQEILESLFSSATKWDVEVVNTIEEMSISTTTAIPLGLIVNEISTNAIKYGFNNKEKPRFSIHMTRDTNNNQYVMTLSNTGNPFPEEIGMENPNTMGLQLVSTLVAQIKGTIELQKNPNPVFTIRFPVEVK